MGATIFCGRKNWIWKCFNCEGLRVFDRRIKQTEIDPGRVEIQIMIEGISYPDLKSVWYCQRKMAILAYERKDFELSKAGSKLLKEGCSSV